MEKKEMREILSVYLQKASKFLFIVAIFIFGYVSSEIYHRIKNSKEDKVVVASPKATKSISKVSVAINERNELMIIDRTNGSYEIYQDSVGRCIFNLYANSLQSKYQNP